MIAPDGEAKTRDVKLSSKLGQIGPKWDISGTFEHQFQYILACRANLTSLITTHDADSRLVR